MADRTTVRQRFDVAVRRRGWPALGLFLALLLLPSCTARRGPLVVTDPDPSVKIPAIQKAVREHDRSAIPQLVKDLDNDDPAVRLYANHALQELTGQDFGFKYFADDEQRAAAAERWRQWLKDHQQGREPNSNTGTAGSGGTGERSGSSAGFRTSTSSGGGGGSTAPSSNPHS